MTFGEHLCELLGLNPDDVASIVVVARAGEAPVARVRMWIPTSNSQIIQLTEKRFKVIEVD